MRLAVAFIPIPTNIHFIGLGMQGNGNYQSLSYTYFTLFHVLIYMDSPLVITVHSLHFGTLILIMDTS